MGCTNSQLPAENDTFPTELDSPMPIGDRSFGADADSPIRERGGSVSTAPNGRKRGQTLQSSTNPAEATGRKRSNTLQAPSVPETTARKRGMTLQTPNSSSQPAGRQRGMTMQASSDPSIPPTGRKRGLTLQTGGNSPGGGRNRVQSMPDNYDGPPFTRDRGQSVYSACSPRSANLKKDRLTANLVSANQDRDITKFYDIDHQEVLGSGLTGQVKKCTHKTTKLQYALKTVNKREMNEIQQTQLRDEVVVMAELDHPNIIRIHEFFENEDRIYLVMDLCTGGELLDRLNQKKGKKYREKDACRIVQTMLSAIKYCHAHNIIHRDLKLENFLFENKNNDAELKLIDFGFSHFLDDEVVHINTVVGTAYYIAPEVLDGNYNTKCDIWSIGIMTYMLLSGSPPFDAGEDKKTIELIKKGKWEFDEKIFSKVSDEAKDFISKCLTMRPGSRPSASQALKHPWFKVLELKRGESSKVDNSLPIITRLQGFAKRTTFQRICMDVMAHTLLPEQLDDLRLEFNKLDLSKSGEISIKDLRKLIDKHPEIDVDIDLIFSQINVERTGKIGYREFIGATMNKKYLTEANLHATFEKMSDRENVITGECLRELIGFANPDLTVESVLSEIGLEEDAEIDYILFKVLLGFDKFLSLEEIESIKKNKNRLSCFKDDGFFGEPNTK